MHCPACQTENDPTRTTCIHCQASLPPAAPAPPAAPTKRRSSRRRNLDPLSDGPLSPQAEACNRAARRAYRLCLLGMAPFLGLVLGPTAVFLGLRVQQQARAVEGFNAQGPVRVAVGLGLAIAATQWVGLGLMLLGLLS